MARGINVPGLVASIAGSRVYAGAPLIDGTNDVSCAAWLAWKHRRLLKRTGILDIEVGPGVSPERYFMLAVEVFKQRASWNVVVLTRPGGKRVFRFEWMGWGVQRRRAKQ